MIIRSPPKKQTMSKSSKPHQHVVPKHIEGKILIQQCHYWKDILPIRLSKYSWQDFFDKQCQKHQSDISYQHVVPISEEGEPGLLLDELAPLVGGHVGHREDREDLLVDVSEGGEVSSECFFVSCVFLFFRQRQKWKSSAKKAYFSLQIELW